MAIAELETVALFAPTVMETVGRPRWFSSRGCVLERDGVEEVFVGGTLVGTFDEARIFERNVLLVQLAEDPRCHLEKLASAFDVSGEWLRRLRRRYEERGVDALRPKDGRRQALKDRERVRLERLFVQGLGAAEAHAKLRRGSLSTIRRW